ncbi:unnamed protein product [Chondrus crispus]|uniref:Methyltransferase domain-containing protein n=1 Tax=Chondrus crispus TaxID=2769 RepID=R7QK00_CHOCR|nr:unnamed protein product [Chondrus crispus]CDF38058.1 unnamed protein product [Chondrus crispus]|eukprot:XP_005717927.1 unnamed protein product [Chondrus crispus]
MLATAAFSGVKSREDSLADKTAVLPVELDRFVTLCQRRSRDREPLQYLVGEWDFHGVKIAVRAPVLFLRPPAEKIVDLALEYANRPGKKGIKNECHLLDGGCGSGAIIIAILSKMKKWTGVGFDIAEEATKLSEENVERHKMTDRVKIMQCTMDELQDERVFDMFVGCPPYVPDKDLSDLPPEVVNHQDRRAVTAGTDGMDVIREFLKHAPRVVRSGGPVFMEIYPPLAPKLEAIQVDGLEFVRCYTNLHEKSYYYEWIVL